MPFENLSLPEEILQAVRELGYTEATEIQSKTIPLLLEGKDVIGRSHTGTGKTAAFGIPAIMQVDADTKGVQVLILCPTRELAMQAADEIRKFARFLPFIHPVAIFGGADIEKQIWSLKRGANIVIGTPGRVIDHLERGTLKLSNIRTVVLDEADEMLNMGFREDIETILRDAPTERQTVLFSATMPPPILNITKEFQKSPVLVGVDQKSRTVESVTQYYYEIPTGRKDDALMMLLSAYEPKLSIVFCNTKLKVSELTDLLVSRGYKAAGLHGDMKQMNRTSVLNSFKSGKIGILIATDVAARGIDVDDVDMVFNYDIPQDNEYYIHRIGRTGRAGKTGESHTLIAGRRQFFELRDIAKFVKAEIIKKALPTKDDVAAAKIKKLFEKITSASESGKYEKYYGQIDSLILESGLPVHRIAEILMGMKLSKDLRNIPDTIANVDFAPPKRSSYQSFNSRNDRGGDRNGDRNRNGRDFRGGDSERGGRDGRGSNRYGDRDSRGSTRYGDKNNRSGGYQGGDTNSNRYDRRSRDNVRRTKVEISLGSNNRIQPGFVLGAFTEATGLEGKNFGKIEIRDNYTTVEVPETEVDRVIKRMTGTKIAGQSLTIQKST
ncbi:MAG: DEAD/DEAH box helicase [Ruminococcus sp.]|jgi:ATP-dependent RNA helicase DeaD|nr:DEAD/DEAH box helicase [Ruminococcus sp.]